MKRIEVQYWPAKQPELFKAQNNFPSLILDCSGKSSYSTPILEYPGLMKVLVDVAYITTCLCSQSIGVVFTRESNRT